MSEAGPIHHDNQWGLTRSFHDASEQTGKVKAASGAVHLHLRRCSHYL
jgi:hypothetical protein